MNSLSMPRWLCLSERAFALSFIAFSFVMFSCLFPTGFSATFSTLAFFFALPTFCNRIRSVDLNWFEIAGLCLFGWLLISTVWSDVPFSVSLAYQSEYRIYFMLPVFISVLALDERTRRWTFIAAMLGAFVALVSSYGLGFGWWKIQGAHLSLGNRIYHGFIMSSFLMACLLIARETNGVRRLISFTIAVSIVYNVLNIEMGRTGYLQVVFVCITFVALTFTRIQAVIAVVCAVFIFGLSYVTFDRFHDRLNQTIANTEKMVSSDDYKSSAGYRLEFYRGAINIGMDEPFTGVGVGGVTKELRSRADTGEMRILTDNVHSEFLNMLIAGGLPGLFLFASFVISIACSGFAVRAHSSWLGDALIGLGVIVLVSALFNSTIKDYGEKHALIVMLSTLGACLLTHRKQFSDTGIRTLHASKS